MNKGGYHVHSQHLMIPLSTFVIPPSPFARLQVRNEFYKDAQGCVLVYDVTNRASFESLGNWMHESREYGAENMVRGTMMVIWSGEYGERDYGAIR